MILSGLGVDGTEGVEALSKKGACIIAETAMSADESSMPQSIINSGYADEILESIAS